MYIEKTFSLCEFYEIYENEKSLFIFCKHRDERGDYKTKMSYKRPENVVLIFEFVDNENTIILNTNTTIEHEINNDEMQDYLLKHLASDTNIIVDMTDMDTKLLAVLLAKLKLITFNKLFMMYSHPANYLRTNLCCESDSDETSSFSHEFKLNDYYKGVEAIPSYFHLDIGYEDKNQTWIIFLGFDRNRTSILDDSKEINKSIIPVISLPAARPGWDKHAYNANFDFFEKNNIFDKISYVSYSSPFQTYSFLKNKQKEFKDDHIIISPLGVKPTTLGSLLFILNNPEVELLFDNPIIKRVRSEGMLNTNVYDVTNYLRGID